MYFWKPSPPCVHFLILLVKIKHPSLSRRRRWRLISLLQRAIYPLLCISLWPPCTYHCTFWALARCTSPCKDGCSEYMFPRTPKMFLNNHFYFVPVEQKYQSYEKMSKNLKHYGQLQRIRGSLAGVCLYIFHQKWSKFRSNNSILLYKYFIWTV